MPAMTTLAGRMMLQCSPLFRGLPPPAFERIAALATQRQYREGEVVCSQGDPGDALYAVVSGSIRISTGTPDGREIFLNIMASGDTFGEIALLDGGTRTATAFAIAPSELVMLRREHLFALLEKEPRVALELLRLCGERLRWTSDLIEEAAFLSLPARLARRLVKMAEEHGSAVAGGLELRISQAELAGFLSVSRQVVNQQLQVWQRKGWVEVGRGRVVVKDVKGLAGVVE